MIAVATDVAARGLGKSFCGEFIGWYEEKKTSMHSMSFSQFTIQKDQCM